MTEEKKSMVPKLRFPGFNETWEQRKLGELAATFGYGLNAAAKSFDGRHKYIRITDIDESTRRFLCSSLTSPDIDFEEAAPYRLAEGDVLFARTGASVGKSYRYVRTDGEVYFAGFLIRFRFKDKEAAEFVFQNSLTAKFQNFIKTSSQRSGQPGINAQQFSGYQIAVPNSEERERIGSFFSRLDTAITLHQRKLEGLSKLKKSLLQKMFPKNGQQNPEVRFPGFTEAWEQRKFQGITQRVSTSSISSIDFPSVEYEDIEAGSGILNKDVKLKEKNKKGIVFDKNDILFGKLRPYLMNWLLADFKGVAVGDFWVLRSQNFDPKFVCSLIQSKSFQEVANRSSGSKMPRADWNLVSNTLFFVPPQNNEQRKIGELFSSLDKVITLHQRKLESLKKLKKSLLQQMFV